MSIKIPECNEFNLSMPEHNNSGLFTAKWNDPRTAEGKQRIAQAQLKHGYYSKAFSARWKCQRMCRGQSQFQPIWPTSERLVGLRNSWSDREYLCAGHEPASHCHVV